MNFSKKNGHFKNFVIRNIFYHWFFKNCLLQRISQQLALYIFLTLHFVKKLLCLAQSNRFFQIISSLTLCSSIQDKPCKIVHNVILHIIHLDSLDALLHGCIIHVRLLQRWGLKKETSVIPTMQNVQGTLSTNEGSGC